MHDDDGEQPDGDAEQLSEVLCGEHQPGSPQQQGDPDGCERDSAGPHQTTSIEDSHLVCSTPGRPGAMTRAG